MQKTPWMNPEEQQVKKDLFCKNTEKWLSLMMIKSLHSMVIKKLRKTLMHLLQKQ